jgi:hypothetical protein
VLKEQSDSVQKYDKKEHRIPGGQKALRKEQRAKSLGNLKKSENVGGRALQ